MSGIDTYTKLLLHCDGVDGATTSLMNSARHRCRWRQIDTAQSVFGGASALFGGSGDYLVANSSDFIAGAGGFAMEWVRPNSLLTASLYDQRPASTKRLTRRYAASGTVKLQQLRRPAPAALSSGNWYHVAVARGSGVTRLFVNGVQDGSNYSDGTNYIGVC